MIVEILKVIGFEDIYFNYLLNKLDKLDTEVRSAQQRLDDLELGHSHLDIYRSHLFNKIQYNETEIKRIVAILTKSSK